ncbi:MAG: DNA-binding transcriptional ArsR family regulator [Salibacteraceae bacterium]
MINLEKINSATQLLKGVAHPVRLAIMEILKPVDQMCVTDIHEKIGVEQAVVSQHLKILKDKKILDSVKEGKHSFYFIKNESFKKLLEQIDQCNECN